MPGSGKTKMLKALAQQDGLAYICPDEIREELTGDEADQSRDDEVWNEARRRIHAALGDDRGLVVDATNAKQSHRLRLIDHCRQKADQIIGVWFTTPCHICKENNRKRKRIVPEEVIESMDNQLKMRPPMQTEGFDKLIKFNPFTQ